LFIIGNFESSLVKEQNNCGIEVYIETKASGTAYYVDKNGNDSYRPLALASTTGPASTGYGC